jgi:hypothetical protein
MHLLPRQKTWARVCQSVCETARSSFLPRPLPAVTEWLDGRQRMSCVAKGLGRGIEGTKETAPHSLTITESRLASNFLDWQTALLEHEPGGLYCSTGRPLIDVDSQLQIDRLTAR